MNQEIFWIVSSINFAFVIILTIANIIVSRKTSLQINYLTRLNSIEQKKHDKLIVQFAEFLSAIDENKITFPVTKLDLITENEVQRDLTFSELSANKSKVEVTYYQLLLLSQYSKSDFSSVEMNINAIITQYRSMYENLVSGLVDHIRYYEAPLERRENIEFLLVSSTDHLAAYSKLRTSFIEQKDNLMKTIREFVNDEIKEINRDLK